MVGCALITVICAIGAVACRAPKPARKPTSPALRVDVEVSAHTATDATVLESPRFSTSARNELLLAFVGVNGSQPGQSITSVDGAGLSWSRVVRANSQAGTAEIWRAAATGKISNASIEVRPSQRGQHGSVTIVSFIAAAVTPGVVAHATGASGAPHLALAGARSGSAVWATGVAADAAARVLAPAQASADQFVDLDGAATYWTQYRSVTAKVRGVVPVGATAPVTSPWNLAAVEVVPAEPGATSVVARTTDCVAAPHLCGFPDATNTGVPAGTHLKRSGSITVTKRGAIIDGRDVHGNITVLADDVTIRNTRITSGSYYPIRYGEKDNTGLLVEDTEIIGTSPIVTSGIAFTHYTALRVNVHGTADGLKIEDGAVVKDSFVHDLAFGTDTHNDGMQSTGGHDIEIVHNTVLAKGAVSCLMFGGENGAPSHILIDNNLLDGGNYSIYLDPHGADRTIVNNHFGKDAVYGVARMQGSYSAHGNLWDSTARLVAM